MNKVNSQLYMRYGNLIFNTGKKFHICFEYPFKNKQELKTLHPEITIYTTSHMHTHTHTHTHTYTHMQTM
jgi:hypothetical protein